MQMAKISSILWGLSKRLYGIICWHVSIKITNDHLKDIEDYLDQNRFINIALRSIRRFLNKKYPHKKVNILASENFKNP